MSLSSGVVQVSFSMITSSYSSKVLGSHHFKLKGLARACLGIMVVTHERLGSSPIVKISLP